MEDEEDGIDEEIIISPSLKLQLSRAKALDEIQGTNKVLLGLALLPALALLVNESLLAGGIAVTVILPLALYKGFLHIKLRLIRARLKALPKAE